MNKFCKFLTALFLIIVLAISGAFGYIVWDNSRVVNTCYTFESDKAQAGLDGFRICVISDFHSSPNYEKVIAAVEEAKPDIICVCGDLVNMEDKEFLNAKALLDGLCKIADTYYAFGNHEVNCKNTAIFEEMIKYSSAKLINDEVVQIEKNGAVLNLVGYGDDIYSDFTDHFENKAIPRLEALTDKLDENAPTVLIMHRPQYFEAVSQLPFDLVISGHLHGGLINIDDIREKILAEHFGTTEYCKGEYTKNGKKLIISSGIAKEDRIYRILNTPEIVTVEVKCK